MFYGIIQKGLDKWNSAYFCGSAAVLRRAALEEAGGFHGASITEDCETALELHSRGWRSLYVDKPLIAGLQPETFADFIGQRTRWCQGMLQILLLKNPIAMSGLSLAQRLCYLSSSMFWLFPLTRSIFLAAPLMYLFFDLQIYNSSLQEFGAYTILYLAAALVLQNYNYGRFRWPWVSELYEYVQTPYLLPAIASVVRNPRRPEFRVTAKGVTTEDDHLSRLAAPYFAIFGVLLAASIVAVLRLGAEPEARGMLLIVGVWNTFNLVLATAALGVLCERRERRRTQRLPISWRGALHTTDDIIPVAIEDASLGGVRIRPIRPLAKMPLRKPISIELQFAADGTSRRLPGTLVNTRAVGSTRTYGLSFGTLDATDYALIAQMLYSDLTPLRRIRQGRRKVRSIVGGTLQIFAWSLEQLMRAIYFLLFRRGSRAAPETTSA
jgi:cellulose synthase (UDP-forming)